MADAINLFFAFGLKPEAAIKYFKQKGYAISWDWHDVREAQQARVFTVAKVTSLDVLTAMRAELLRAKEKGTTFAEFKKTLTPRLQSLGWWGRAESLDLETGEIRKVQMGSPRRLETIYRANVQSAYMAGRYETMRDNIDERPYWQYVAIHDARTRPSHMALDGQVFRADDPIWNNIYPPNDWGCRCRVRALSERQVRERKITVRDSADYTEHWTDTDKEGNEFPRTSIQTPGMPGRFATGAGWNGNPGRSGLLEGLDHKLDHGRSVWVEGIVDDMIDGETLAAFIKNPIGDVPIAMLTADAVETLGVKTAVVRLSADTMIKQLATHPELTLADYQSVRGVISYGLKVHESAGNMVYVLFEDDLVVVVKATQTGQGLFATSIRRLSRNELKRDRELARLIEKAEG